jgi:DNA (cytosine-5)-methyltransferase 1
MFTFGSLFSGIGGIDLGLERAGMACRWQVENDEYATKVLAKHWPNVARYGDIRCISPLERVDLIAGGFPCQDISSAGKRAGITGERSGLWSEFYRLICELRPRYVLVENVAALLYGGIDTVLGNLAQSGYDTEWQILPAEAFGAPHLRERVFIVAYTTSGRQQECQSSKRFHDQSHSSSDVSDATGNRCEWRQCQPLTRQQERSSFPGQEGNGQQMAYTDFQSLEVGQVFGRHAAAQLSAFKRDCSTGTGVWTVEPAIRRVASRVPSRMDRLRGLGNAVVPQVAEYVGRLIMEHAHAATLTL